MVQIQSYSHNCERRTPQVRSLAVFVIKDLLLGREKQSLIDRRGGIALSCPFDEGICVLRGCFYIAQGRARQFAALQRAPRAASRRKIFPTRFN